MWLRLLYQYYKTEAFVCWYTLISIDAIEQFLLVLGDLCINFFMVYNTTTNGSQPSMKILLIREKKAF